MADYKGHPTDKYIDHTIQHVSAITGTQKVYAEWVNGEITIVDFSDLILKNKQFKTVSDPINFQTVKHIDWGHGIEWDCGVAIGSDQLRYMADEQDTVIHKQRLAG